MSEPHSIEGERAGEGTAARAKMDHVPAPDLPARLHRALLACYQPHVRLPHHGMAENQFHPLAVRLLAVLEGAWERDLLARARR